MFLEIACYAPFSGASSIVYYILGDNRRVEVLGLNRATINGIACTLNGEVRVAEELNVIRNICDWETNDYGGIWLW